MQTRTAGSTAAASAASRTHSTSPTSKTSTPEGPARVPRAELRRNRDLYWWTERITACNDPIRALELLGELKSSRTPLRPTTPVYNAVLDVVAKSGHWNRAWKLFNDMKKRGLRPDAKTYGALLNAVAQGQVDRSEIALRLLQQAREDASITVNEVLVNTVLKIAVRHARSWDWAEDVLRQHAPAQLTRPSPVTATHLLSLAGVHADVKRAVAILDRVKASRLDSAAWFAAFSVCRTAERPDIAEGMLMRMLATGARPSVRQLDVLYASCRFSRHFNILQRFIAHRRRHEVPADAQLLNSEIRALARCGGALHADVAYEEARRAGVLITLPTYTTMIRAHQRAKRPQRVAQLQTDMRAQGLQADRVMARVLQH